MAKGYRPGDRVERFLVPTDLRGWLPAHSSGCVGVEGGGMQVAACARESATRSGDALGGLAGEAVAAHAAADQGEDGLFGAGRRGDEVPPEAWRPRRRDERIAAALASLRAEREAAE